MAIFEGLEEGELTKIASLCSVIHKTAGEMVLRAGKTGDLFYMVMDGEMDILSPDSSHSIGKVTAGDFLGEISLVSRQPYTATAVAATDVQLVALKYQDFENLINRYPRIGLRVMRNIAISVGEKLRLLNLKT